MPKLLQSDTFQRIVKDKQLQIYDNLQPVNESYATTTKLDNKNYEVANEEFLIQRQIRPLFGRKGTNNKSIASHPDFEHLMPQGGLKEQYICAVFIDIRGSTRLSLKYDLPFVITFKNAVIQTCIEFIRTFDGFVHRIMGDAVLGFFGDSTISKEEAIINCLNCVSLLNYALKNNIQPWLHEQKPDFDIQDFGFRIGCNFGDDNEILWANYGYGEVGEISPTGFPVDVAAKLQGLSRKNQIMLGQGLLEFINFPIDFSNIQKRQSDGIMEEVPYLIPNYVKNGQSINYIMRELNIDKYLEGLPIETIYKDSISTRIKSNHSIKLTATITLDNGKVFDLRKGQLDYSNNPIIRVIPKNSKIIFSLAVTNTTTLKYPLSVKFIKKNQLGLINEEKLERTINLKDEETHTIHYRNNRINQTNCQYVYFQRNCEFRGIHQVICEVRNNLSELIFRDIINVPIL